MIHEYALEPELVATWGNRHDYRYFLEKFGLGQPRIVSRYPKRWKKLVWDAFQSANDVERKRLEVLLARLSEYMVHRRDSLWQAEASWLENAVREHERVPFHAIVARANATGHSATLVADTLDESIPMWAVSRGRTIGRSAQEMAGAVAQMLRIANIIIFVDPYFRANQPRFRRPLEAFLRLIVEGRSRDVPAHIEIHASLDYDGAPECNFFQNECQQSLQRCLPTGMQLSVLRLTQKSGGEILHNRYILTDLGGVEFRVGLDDGVAGETDDVTLMERAQYEIRWSQYVGDPMAFDVPETRIEVRSRD